MAINSSLYTITPEDTNLGLVGLSQKLFGSSDMAATLATMNGLQDGSVLTPGQQIKVGQRMENQGLSNFARSYAASLPTNATISQGLPDPLNPNAIVRDPNILKVNNAATNFFFDPLERKQYEQTVVPQRIQENRQLGQILERANQAGTIGSSLDSRLSELLGQTTQQAINQDADQINASIETQRINEEQRRLMDQLNQTNLIANELVQNNFEQTPEQAALAESIQNAPQETINQLAQLVARPVTPFQVSLRDLLASTPVQPTSTYTQARAPSLNLPALKSSNGTTGVPADGKPRNSTVESNEKLLIEEAKRQGITNPAQIAYILGTASHESGTRPIRERGGDAYLSQYQGRLGNNAPGDGIRYAGRGFTQLTGKNNYAKYSKILGVDLVGNPDLALDPTIAARIMIDGIKNGSFTGVSVNKYTRPDGSVDFYQARRVVNGMVPKQAQDVANKSQRYLARLTSGDLAQFI